MARRFAGSRLRPGAVLPLDYPLTAILSDLHGNAPALETAVADAHRRGARRFVCLGDVVGYGARPRHNLELVMRLCVSEPQVPLADAAFGPTVEGLFNGSASAPVALAGGLCLLGNHEHALMNGAEDFNPRARAAIEWTRSELSRSVERERSWAYWDFLEGLAPSATDERAMFAHGSPRDPVREYLLPRDAADEAKMRANFEHLEAPICFIGHSHVPAIYFEDGRLLAPRLDSAGATEPLELAGDGGPRAIVNVGSVGQPRDGDPRLSYVLFDGQSLSFVRLDYDVAAAAAAIRAVPELPDYLADRLAVGR